MHGVERQVQGGPDVPRFHVVCYESEAFVDDAVKIRGLLVQCVAAQHRPMAVDDLRGAEALGLDIGQDLSYRVGRRTIAADHRLKRLRVVHHRTERLTELVRNRARERRHRLAPAGVSGERQVPAALHLGPLPGTPLVQQPDNQERLERQHANGAQHRAPVFLPQARSAEAHNAVQRQPALGECPIASTRANRRRAGRVIAAVP